MIDKPKQGATNLNVMGIAIRTNRIKKGYSLRDLAELTNISHTLISNIEKGKQTPSESTLADIFRALEMEYHEDPKLGEEISYYYTNAMTHIINHDYDEAGELVEEMMKKEEIYRFSNQLISYLIIKLLYFALTNRYLSNRDELIEQYEQVYEFFTDEQKQMFNFIRGLDMLNDDYYFQATEYFNTALKLGNAEWDPIIKEYNIRALVRQFKFTDSNAHASSSIEELEKRTIYLRAMRIRLLIARIYLHIANFDKMGELVNYVELFATKFKVDVLTNECKVLRAWMHYLKEEYDEALEQLDSCTDPEDPAFILPRFRVYVMKQDDRLVDYYNDIIKNKQDVLTRKKFLLIQVLMMWKVRDVRDDEIYLKNLLELKDFVNLSKDQENITLTHNLLIQFYKEKKRYKKALDIAEEFLHIKKIGL